MRLSDITPVIKAKRIGDNWQAKCPAHKDDRASLSLSEREGKLLLRCHAGCDFESITNALINLGIKNEMENKKTEYEYQDSNGNPRLKVTRVDQNGSKNFYQSHWNGSEYVMGSGIGEIAPFQYDFWKESSEVYFSEGEKCALSLVGLPSTCIPRGANGWKEEYAKFFKGKTVYILPDNDEPGKKFSQKVFDSLKNIAKPKIIPLPVGEGEDVYDYLQKNSISDLRALCFLEDSAIPEVAGKNWELVSECEAQEKYCEESYGNEIKFGINFLDKLFLGIMKNDLILVGAKTGSGKTSIVTSIASNAIKQGKTVYQFALEAHPYEITTRLRYNLVSQKFYEGMRSGKKIIFEKLNYPEWIRGKWKNQLFDIEQEVKKEMKDKYGKYFVQYKKQDFTSDKLISEMNLLKGKADLIVIDHFHFLDFSENENKSMTDAAKKIQDTAFQIGIPVILVAHIRKTDKKLSALVPDIEDFHGTSNLAKICTKAIMLAPAYEHQKSTTLMPTYVRAAKFREDMSRCVYVGLIDFDITQQSYGEDFAVGKLSGDGKTFKQIDNNNDRPYWIQENKELNYDEV